MPDTNNDTQQITPQPFTLYNMQGPKEEASSEGAENNQTTQPPLYEETTTMSPIFDEVPVDETSTIQPSPTYEALYGNGNVENNETTTIESIGSLDEVPVTVTPIPEVFETTIAGGVPPDENNLQLPDNSSPENPDVLKQAAGEPPGLQKTRGDINMKIYDDMEEGFINSLIEAKKKPTI
ncbi:hypothetical protein K0B04_02335 [Patescibacteria group bacterium]|nr:hypothetical protein [Patescibacteria group bacterium]